MISLQDQSTSVSIAVGEKVTIRLEECPRAGLLWGLPYIEGDGIELIANREIENLASSDSLREFVFDTRSVGRYTVTSDLRQAGIEQGVKRFFMIINVTSSALM